MSKQIRVRVKQPGVYGHLRTEGDHFHIQDESHFSGRWMEHVDEEGMPVKNSSIQKRYDEEEAEKAKPIEPIVIQVEHGKKKPASKGPSGPGMHDDAGIFDADGNQIVNDAANPQPGITDPGQKAQIESVVEHKLHDDEHPAKHQGFVSKLVHGKKEEEEKPSHRASDKKAI